MITVVVIIKKVLCIYKFEPFLSHYVSITVNEDMNINDTSGSYISNIQVTKYRMLCKLISKVNKIILILLIYKAIYGANDFKPGLVNISF